MWKKCIVEKYSFEECPWPRLCRISPLKIDSICRRTEPSPSRILSVWNSVFRNRNCPRVIYTFNCYSPPVDGSLALSVQLLDCVDYSASRHRRRRDGWMRTEARRESVRVRERPRGKHNKRLFGRRSRSGLNYGFYIIESILTPVTPTSGEREKKNRFN